EYRSIDAPTDVLSFSMGEWYEDAGQKIYRAGDIVISIPALYRNAEEFHVAPDEELKRLLIHGILHLEGMDHETNDSSEPMLIQQEAILAEFAGGTLL
ncbi:MAG: rRNA maturation RNase YbeY, partial [Spirochaetia bacterium]|nr:rRNA maturation RNase YbeY [Spirochaetia bacterium]